MTNLSSISNTSEPFVNFQCSCTTPTKVYYNTPNPSFPREALNLMQSQLLTQPLSELNYCQECNAIKCNRCTTEQISFYYCPQCQFDVPSAAVSGEKIRCPRNCLECPICSNFLSIIEEVETQLVTEVDESNGKANINLYNYLYCEICRWDSRELNLTFDKVTHVSSVVEKTQQKTQIDNVEFKNLESHFDLKYMIPYHLNTHASLASIIPHPDFQVDLNDLLVEGKRNYVPTTKSKELEGYESLEVACKLMEDKLVDKMENLNVAYEATPFHQQMKRTEKKMYPNQPVYPQRQVLKCRKERSCRTCSTVLVRPHTKAAYLDKFKIKLPALTFVPHIFISQLPDLQPGKKVRVALKILNPLFYKVYLQLSSPCASNWLVPDLPPSKEYPHDIQFLSPKFFVDSFKEAWDDDDDDELKNDDLSSDEDDSESAKGILDRYYNTTTIGIDVIINGEPGSKVILPILMSYTFRLPKEGTDEQSAETKKSRKVTCHAWVYIRLGEVN